MPSSVGWRLRLVAVPDPAPEQLASCEANHRGKWAGRLSASAHIRPVYRIRIPPDLHPEPPRFPCGLNHFGGEESHEAPTAVGCRVSGCGE